MKTLATGGGAEQVHPLAGKPAPESLLVNVPKLVTAYYSEHPDPSEAAQRVVFGTSGHRGSSLQVGFNEAHVLAITQAICLYRRAHGIDGPLFLGWDTHALSEPARVSALEVLAANGVEVMVDVHDDVTPTPVISQAILALQPWPHRGARGRHRDHPVPQPAGVWRHQVRPALRRSGRHARHRLDPGRGQRASRGRAAGRGPDPLGAGAAGGDRPPL